MTRCDQVIVEVALFYRLDGRLFFAKGREQRASGVGMVLARLREEFGSVHIRQTLARQDKRHWLAFVSQLPQRLKGINTRSSLDGPVPLRVTTIKVARNNLARVRVIIDYKYDWLTHDRFYSTQSGGQAHVPDPDTPKLHFLAQPSRASQPQIPISHTWSPP